MSEDQRGRQLVDHVPAGAPARRRLAVVYDPDAISPIQLHGSLRDLCDLIWLVDASRGPLGDGSRLLPRLGRVVDLTGLDEDACVRAVARAEPDGVVCFSDRCVWLTSVLTAALGLPGMHPRVASAVLDKSEQREAFAAAGMRGPRVWRVRSDDPMSMASALSHAAVPVIVKPLVGEGSRHVEAAADRHRLREVLTIARDAGRDSVVEELLVGDPAVHPEIGDYVSIESVASRGAISHVAITGRFPLAKPFRETGFFMPARVDDDVRQDLLDVATAAILALGLETACVHTEIKLTPDGPSVIEVNGRLGGGMADMLLLAAGVDLVSIAARVALGERVVFDELVPMQRTAYLLLTQAPMAAVRVEGIEGLDDVARVDGVQQVRVNLGIGSDLDWREGTENHVFSILGSAAGFEELLGAARVVRETSSVSYRWACRSERTATSRPQPQNASARSTM